MADNNMQELISSELGTQNYWDRTYSLEKNNFKSHGDVGEVWFGEDSALRVVRWMCSKPEVIKPDATIIDLGCGNGMMLVELHEEGFHNLTGVDYSQNAIDLATEVLRSRDLTNVPLKVCDILSDDKSKLPGHFEIAHDKGTYDAISLNPDDPRSKRLKYMENVREILSPDGLLIITSCNWTEDELAEQFEKHFRLLHVIPTPCYRFAGKTGNTVTSCVFRRI